MNLASVHKRLRSLICRSLPGFSHRRWLYLGGVRLASYTVSEKFLCTIRAPGCTKTYDRQYNSGDTGPDVELLSGA